jgi:hypothetical protein
MKSNLRFLLILPVSLFTCSLLTSGHASTTSIFLSFSDGNWQGDACTTGGLDAGDPGDQGTLVISADGDMNYPPFIDTKVDLPSNLSGDKTILMEFCFRSNSMQTSNASIYWDGIFVLHIDAYGTGEELKTISHEVLPGQLSFNQGVHILRITAENTPNQWDYFQLDAVRIGPRTDPVLRGGHLIPFEILPLAEANWKGDGGTWGGLDGDATFKSDRATAIVKSGSTDYPPNIEFKTTVSTDFSHSPVQVTIGIRRNQRMATQGQVFWDGRLLLDYCPYLEASQLHGLDSILEETTVLCKQEEFNFSPGEHTIRISVPPSQSPKAMFQIDSILLESFPVPPKTTKVYLNDIHFCSPTTHDEIVTNALNHFQNAANELGAATFTVCTTEPETTISTFRIGTCETDSAINQSYKLIESVQNFGNLQPFQRSEAFFIISDSTLPVVTLSAGGLQPLGTVFAISELELRLRKDSVGVYLDFPEWLDKKEPLRIVSVPSMEVRGEYMNIGYNHKGITPHEWDQERWHTYIDQLVLARLNRFYFYIWNDVYTMYPGSIHSKQPLNKQIHENVRDMITYAHKRGLKVTYMMCPTYFPSDIWTSHPEIHAEIEYVDHGFPAVCPQAPGAWDMMKDIARSEMEWFSEADALQIWFYDPGGCWCKKNGCYQDQAGILARQVKEFSGIFNELNPRAAVEYNIWPIWLWEDTLGLKYRKDLDLRVKDLAGVDYSTITAVGASDNNITLPLMETDLGFQGTAFIFGANPESGYDFLIPHLTYLKQTAQRVLESGVNGAFGHRLEAWTRYPATFFMGQFLWDPNTTKEDVVNKYAQWITADYEAGIQLSESILLLDQFTFEGANPLVGGRMSRLTHKSFEHVPESHKRKTEYFPPMMEALAIIGRSINIEDNAALSALSSEFGHTLSTSVTLQPIANDKNYLFDKYRTFLIKGWKNSPF